VRTRWPGLNHSLPGSREAYNRVSLRPRGQSRLWAAAAFAAAVACREGTPADPVILELGDDVVRRSDFARHLAEVEARGGAPLTSEVRRSLLDSFLEQRVLVLEARARGLLTGPGTPAEEQRAVQKLLEKTIPEIRVGDEEVAAYFRDHPEELQLEEQLTLRQILVPTLNEARDVRRRLLKEPKSFETLARSVSRSPEAPNGGLMGTFTRGQLPADLERAAFALAPETPSEIVESSLGYHILRVEDRRPARAAGLEEAQARIRARLVQEKTDRAQRALVASLLQRAKVNHAAALSASRLPS
jgi:peptidyl-prolyl cis-trans isomerase C